MYYKSILLSTRMQIGPQFTSNIEIGFCKLHPLTLIECEEPFNIDSKNFKKFQCHST